MKVTYSETGMVIDLNKKDKESVEKGNKLEAILDKDRKKVILSIKEKIKRNGGFEEGGFHIRGNKTTYKIYLEKRIWDRLTDPIPKEAWNNYFGSRSVCDRIEFLYWGDNI